MPTTPLLGITQVSASQNNKEVTINDAITALESAGNARLVVSFAASADITLSNTQATRNFVFEASAATGASTLRFPNTISGVNFNRVFTVRNNSGHSLTVRFATGAGTTVVIPNGEARLIAAINALDMIDAAQPGTSASLLSLSDTPGSYAGQANKVLVVNVSETGMEFVSVATFPSYVSNGGKVLAVNITEDGVEWIDATEAATFTDMTDTPSSYTGQAGKLVAVNEAEDGLEFIEALDPEATLYASASRWRILVVEKGTEDDTGFGEVAFLDKDGFDLTGSGAASASNFATGFEPGLAFDNLQISGTGWLTETTYAGVIWLEYDFGTPVSPRSVRLSPITDAAEFTPTRFQFQFWSGTAWVTVGDRIPQPWISGEDQTFRINGLPFINLYPMGGFFFTAPPSANQVLFLHSVTDACTIADNFAGSVGDVGTNPAVTFTMDVSVNGASVGTIEISAGGVFSFNTTGGAINLVAGDVVKVTAPATPGTAENVSVTLRATM